MKRLFSSPAVGLLTFSTRLGEGGPSISGGGSSSDVVVLLEEVIRPEVVVLLDEAVALEAVVETVPTLAAIECSPSSISSAFFVRLLRWWWCGGSAV